MVTISPTRIKRFPLTRLRWKILLAILLIVLVSFAVIASSLTRLVSNYLYEQRIRQDSYAVEQLATTLAPLFQSASSDALTEAVIDAGNEMGGRLLVIDTDGKVQCDSFSLLCGVRLSLPEVLSVLTGGENAAYGIHRLTDDGALSAVDDAGWVSYCSALMTGTRGRLGVVLFVSTVGEMMESLSQVERQMMTAFVLVAAAAVVCALVFARVITEPVTSLTKTIQKMGKGDLSVRAPVKGSGEMRELAVSYNTMAARLESLDQSRNQFVSNASHELKTPLSSMKILLESMMYQPDMPQELREEFMQDMDHEIDRLTGIITDLLTLTRMDNHRMELHAEPMNLSEVVEETLHLLQPMVEKRGQRLIGHIAPMCTLIADQSKLEQVIYNLTENAVKYTPEGGEIHVTLTFDANVATLSVKDNGVGIPEEDQAHIFERFYRVDKARSRETGGTGLGLSIVRQLVNLHGGTVTVQSVAGEGSTFIVTLPRKEVDG